MKLTERKAKGKKKSWKEGKENKNEY